MLNRLHRYTVCTIVQFPAVMCFWEREKALAYSAKYNSDYNTFQKIKNKTQRHFRSAFYLSPLDGCKILQQDKVQPQCQMQGHRDKK